MTTFSRNYDTWELYGKQILELVRTERPLGYKP